MKSLIVSLVLLGSSLGLMDPVPAEYNVTVHVIASKSLPCSIGDATHDNCRQHLNVLIDGKKYELEADAFGVLALGDYPAKQLSEIHRSSYEGLRRYQLWFPDGKTRTYGLVGILE
jgi:hypothetical protein